jgi:hypothetical protein
MTGLAGNTLWSPGIFLPNALHNRARRLSFRLGEQAGKVNDIVDAMRRTPALTLSSSSSSLAVSDGKQSLP